MRARTELALTDIPRKANIVLQLILLGFLLLFVRVAYLTLNQHQRAVKDAYVGRKITIVEPAPRGTIRDCDNKLLAGNQIEYRVGLLWGPIRKIQPRAKRQKYVRFLCRKIGAVIGENPLAIEDILYSFAALNSTTPYVLQATLTEREYAQLTGLRHLLPGLVTVKGFQRIYPQGSLACHVVGYTAPIQKEEYNKLIMRRHRLEHYLKMKEIGLEADFAENVEQDLQIDYATAKAEHARLIRQNYTFADRIGRAGIEAWYEESLRGQRGFQRVFSNAKGATIRPLTGSMPVVPGKRILLTISSELQAHCEKLLALSEPERSQQFMEKYGTEVKQPKLRGGAIVAIDPKDGKIVALASFPRFDPNQFETSQRHKTVKKEPDSVKENHILAAPKERSIQPVDKALRSHAFLTAFWNQAAPFSFELYNNPKGGSRGVLARGNETLQGAISVGECWFDWDLFLDLLLPPKSPIKLQLHKGRPVEDLQRLQKIVLAWATWMGGSPLEFITCHLNSSHALECAPDALLQTLPVLERWFQGMEKIQERVALIDISRMVIRDLNIPLKGYTIESLLKEKNRYFLALSDLKNEMYEKYWSGPFRKWRKLHEEEYLKECRKKEKNAKTTPAPYLVHLKQYARQSFEKLWEKYKRDWIETLWRKNYQGLGAVTPRLFSLLEDLIHPAFELWGNYRGSPKRTTGYYLLTTALAAYQPGNSSLAFQTLSPQGSIFKLAVAYAALLQRFKETQGTFKRYDTNFFEIIDQTYKVGSQVFVGKFLNEKPIPQIFKGGRIPKSSHAHFGRLDLLKAIAVSSNPYFSLLASEYLDSPKQLETVAKNFGLGSLTGIDLPFEKRGTVPDDLDKNKTGVYTTAIGQHTLTVTPVQTAVMLSAFANGGKIMRPYVLKAKIAPRQMEKGFYLPKVEALHALGIEFPLFIDSKAPDLSNRIEYSRGEVLREVEMPPEVQATVALGMQKAVQRLLVDKQLGLKRFITLYPEFQQAIDEVADSFIGKSSTAEVQDRLGLDIGQKTVIYNHIWFGGQSKKPKSDGISLMATPELVVVIYLRYGGYGRDVFPLAASVVQKWRNIQRKKSHLR